MKPITNIQEAIKFVKEKECGQIQEVNIKYMVKDNLKDKFERLLEEYINGDLELEGYCGE